MTIAMCYVLPEGVILGADSTTSAGGDAFHYFNNNQKVFEVGHESSLGILTWGWASTATTSYRTLIANLADSFSVAPTSVADAVSRWADVFYAVYEVDPIVVLLNQLHGKLPFDPNTNPPPLGARTEKEEQVYQSWQAALTVGFCLAGRVAGDRTPFAYELLFEPLKPKPTASVIPMGRYRFWGVPNMADRLLFGADIPTREAIVNSPHWSGTRADLDALLTTHELRHSSLPIRDAIDFVHMCIHSTIKALKFSPYSQVCGGPIEIATITTDRPFRWVRHKKWDAAITESEL